MSAAFAILSPVVGGFTGVSPEAERIAEAAQEVISISEQSTALFGHRDSVVAELWSLMDECGEADWDGAGAAPLDDHAVASTIAFIRALPFGLAMPELAPDPDGAVSLDWIVSKTRMFSVSCGPSGRLAYSWLDGTDRGHAVAGFNGWTIPQRILNGIRSITSNSPNSLQFA